MQRKKQTNDMEMVPLRQLKTTGLARFLMLYSMRVKQNKQKSTILAADYYVCFSPHMQL